MVSYCGNNIILFYITIIVLWARHFYLSVSEVDKESGYSGQSFVTAASICVALVKPLIFERGDSVWLPNLRVDEAIAPK